jgi:hypothetical protein
MNTRTKIVLAAALAFTGAGTALANEVENNASVSQINREWAENHGRSYLDAGETAYGFVGTQKQVESNKQMKARER